MRHDSLAASVQYGDYSGTVAADRHDQRDIDDLAKKNGIDTERYFVFGLDLHIGETRRDTLAKTYVSILAVDTQVVKAFGVDPIQRYVDENDGILPYVDFPIDATLEEVLLLFKRFDAVIRNSYIMRVKEFRRSIDED